MPGGRKITAMLSAENLGGICGQELSSTGGAMEPGYALTYRRTSVIQCGMQMTLLFSLVEHSRTPSQNF
jgi:hypothetical protein